MDIALNYQSHRRFGVELELNTLNGVIVKLKENKKENPFGADKVACIINRTTKKPVEIHGWSMTHNNNFWVVKPDSSCGIEVCSPVVKGWEGLSSIMRVAKAFADNDIRADKRCSLHVHVNIADLTKTQLATVMAYYIKCEHIIFDSLPENRKNNKYCQFIGNTDLFSTDFDMNIENIIYFLSLSKYNSINAFHFMNGGGFEIKNNTRKTIEFRVAESDACLDPFFIKNWVRFLIHFVEMTKNLPYPKRYKAGCDKWSGLLWLDPIDMFKILKFDMPLSKGLKQVRNWFLLRYLKNCNSINNCSIFSNSARIEAKNEMLEIAKINLNSDDSFNFEDYVVFGNNYII